MTALKTFVKRRWLLAAALMAALCLGGLALLGASPAASAQGDQGAPPGVVCIYKQISSAAGSAGFTTDDVTLSVSIDQAPSTSESFVSIEPGSNCFNESDSHAVEILVPFEGQVPSSKTVSVTEVSTEPAFGLSRFTNCTETATTNVATSNVSITINSGEQRSCTFVNDTIPVCVFKEFNGDSLALGIDFEDPPWEFVVQSQMQSVPVVAIDACEGPGFYVAPGAQFKISETIDDDYVDRIGLVEASCTAYPGEGDNATAVADDTGVVTMTPPRNSDFWYVDCEFINASIAVCVMKGYGDGGAALLDAELASLADVEFSRDGGPGESPGPSCGYMPAVPYFVAPGATATISETITAGSPMRPVDIQCEQFVQSSEPYELVGVAVLETASITIPTSVDNLAPIDCWFTNDALIVCVTKSLNDIAFDLATPGDFTFDLAPSQGDPQQLVPGPEAPLCNSRLQPSFQEGQELQELLIGPGPFGTVGVALPPGTMFSLTEQDPGPSIGLVYAECIASGRLVEADRIIAPISSLGAVDLEARSITGIAHPSDTGSGRIDCYFENASVLVCVTKDFGDAAAGLGFTELGTFDARANGVLVADDAVPGQTQQCPTESSNVFSFNVAPGSAVDITETVAIDNPLGLVDAECSWQGEGPVTVPTSLAGQTVQFTHTEGSVINCTLTNDVVALCVVKQLGPNAEAAGFEATDFVFTVDSNATVVPVENGCEGPGARSSWAVTPNAGMTITESHSLGDDAPIGLVNAECKVGQEGGDQPSVDLVAGSLTIAEGHDSNQILCIFGNETVVVCVTKTLSTNAQAALTAGDLTFADFSFELQVDGVAAGDAVVAGEKAPTVCQAPASDDGPASSAVAELLGKPGATYTVTELVADGVPAKTSYAQCESTNFDGNNSVSFTPETVQSEAQPEPNYLYDCEFNNHSVAVTVLKTLITDNGSEASVGDFLFDVFDDSGTMTESGLATGAVFYVAPGATFTIAERLVPGFTTSASCASADVLGQALDGAPSVTHTAGTSVNSVDCTFVNDDVPPIPVCALLILDEGTTGFTLDDFSLELYKDGALIGERSAGDPFDAACEDTTDNTANLLPGSLVQLGEVFADGGSFAFAVSVADPDDELVFEPLSCTVDGPQATQALSGPDAALFTLAPGSRLATCVARVGQAPLQTGGGGSTPGGERPTYVAPVVAAAAAAPAPAPAQVLPVVPPLAVTGSSTNGVTVPIGLALLSAGFIGLGLGRRRRRFS